MNQLEIEKEFSSSNTLLISETATTSTTAAADNGNQNFDQSDNGGNKLNQMKNKVIKPNSNSTVDDSISPKTNSFNKSPSIFTNTNSSMNNYHHHYNQKIYGASPPPSPANFVPQGFTYIHQKKLFENGMVDDENNKISPRSSPNLLNGFDTLHESNKTNVNQQQQQQQQQTTPLLSSNNSSSTTTPSLTSNQQPPVPTSPSLESPGKKKFVSNNISVGVLSKDKINLLLIILKQKNHIQSIDQKISIYLSIEELIALILEELAKRKIPLSKCGIRLVGSTASNIISHTKQDKHYDFNDIDLNFYLYRVTNFTNLLDLEETVIAREVFRQTGVVISKKEVFNNFFRERVKVLNYQSTVNTPIPILHPKQFINNNIGNNNLNSTPILSSNVNSESLPLNHHPTPPLLPLSTPTTPIMTPIVHNNGMGASNSLPSTPTTSASSGLPPFTSEVSDDWSLISLGCDGETPRNIDIKFIRKISRAYAFSLDSFHIILDPIVENYQSLLPHKNLDQSYKDIPIPLEPVNSTQNNNTNINNKYKHTNNNILTPTTSSLYSTTKNNINQNNNSNIEENEKLNILNEKVEILNNESMNLDSTSSTSTSTSSLGSEITSNSSSTSVTSSSTTDLESIKVEDSEVSSILGEDDHLIIIPEQSNEVQNGSSPIVSPPSLSTTNSISSTLSQHSSNSTTNNNSNESSPSPLSFSLSPTSSTDSFSLLTSNHTSGGNSQDDTFQPLSLDSQKHQLRTSSNSVNSSSSKKQSAKNYQQGNEEFPPLIASGANKSTLDQNHQQNSWNQNLALKLNNQTEEKKKYLESIINHQNNINIQQNNSNNSNINSLNSSNNSINSHTSINNNTINNNDEPQKVNETKDDKQQQQPQNNQSQPQQHNSNNQQKKKKVGNQQKNRNQIENQLPSNVRVKVISIYGNYCKAKNDLENGRLNSVDPKQIRRGIFRYCHELAKGRVSTEPNYFDRVFRETFFTQDLMKPSEFQTTLLKYIKKHKNLALIFLKYLESLLVQPYRTSSPIPISLIPMSSSSLLPIPAVISPPSNSPSLPPQTNLINSTSTTPSNSTPSSPTMVDTMLVMNESKINNNTITANTSSNGGIVIPQTNNIHHPHNQYHNHNHNHNIHHHHNHHHSPNLHHNNHHHYIHNPSSPSMAVPTGPLIIEKIDHSPSISSNPINISSGSNFSHGLPPLPLLPHSPKPFSSSPKTHSQTPTFYDMFYLEYLNIISYLRSKLTSGDIDSLWEKKMI